MNLGKTEPYSLIILTFAALALFFNINASAQQLKPNEKLAIAVLSDDFNGVKDALSKGADINAVNESGETVLFTALTASFSQLDKFDCNMIRLLTDNGAKVDIRSRDGQTPLFIACSQGFIPDIKRAELIQLLISRGADTEIKANVHMYQEGTPLLYAAMNGYVKTMNVLIENGANPLVKDEYGNNALWWAVKGDPSAVAVSDKLEIVRMLINKGVDPLSLNESGESALSLAEESGSKLLADALKGKKTSGIRDEKKIITRADLGNAAGLLTPDGKLKAAVMSGDPDQVKQSILEGAEITLKDENGNNALLLAADFTLDIIAGNDNSNSEAKLNNRFEIIKYLINNGADINAVNHQSENALGVAVKSALAAGRKNISKTVIETVRYLISRGSVVDLDTDTTPLMEACDAASAELVDILLPHVKKINRKSNDIIQITPLAFAIGTEAIMLANNRAFEGFMDSSGKKIINRTKTSGEIRLTSDPDRLKIVKSLIKHGADVNLDSGGIMPLLQAETAGLNEIVILLKNSGAKK